MYRYHLIASFNKELKLPKYKIISEKSKVQAQLPMLTTAGNFRYGLQTTINELKRQNIYPSETGYDAIIFGLMVYIADMKISRIKQSQDSWTREIILSIPVYDNRWEKHKEILERMLRFLTGDIWTIEFSKRGSEFVQKEKRSIRTEKYETASLFSGGMDSLIASINYMEQKQPTLLVSHAGESRVRSWQTNLLKILDHEYPDVCHENAYLWTSLRDIELPEADQDKNQRSRSFLFIAIAMFAMSGTKNCTRLFMPENGLIALNVPLDSTRVGSHSTKTTHPFYLKLWNEISQDMFGISITNPYWNKTKGEMAAECLNKDILKVAMGESFSCSSVNNASIRGGHSQHCGHCLPCIIRRAAMYHAFGAYDPSEYLYSEIKNIENNRELVGEQLRSFQYAIRKVTQTPNAKKILIHKSGPLKNDEKYLTELSDMYYRGLMEVEQWIQDNGGKNNC
ncbi:Qat anti-phage system QueC-like protein QatC [Lacrimispora sphenoides]|uniref:7-cyano-7-deazaguanine synthase (Queuosine biosynthesis) n=1 Tax=Lacrimispora sphenoides JCM 1415 TaxID=1297793 RepID=A0ABY1C2A3_9FIRM|nr:Qat anti-phage system QueC-like protein QatC [Lacrimispora sphenoides]SET56080.1 7-cyano-7-deazaguanine synthase (queuosine biosynthesis) [[Clostridium] sphenoides JCM 1415]SUY49761.1 putative PP-loop superfamily ATPase [Lacrimispora sphenoides]